MGWVLGSPVKFIGCLGEEDGRPEGDNESVGVHATDDEAGEVEHESFRHAQLLAWSRGALGSDAWSAGWRSAYLAGSRDGRCCWCKRCRSPGLPWLGSSLARRPPSGPASPWSRRVLADRGRRGNEHERGGADWHEWRSRERGPRPAVPAKSTWLTRRAREGRPDQSLLASRTKVAR